MLAQACTVDIAPLVVSTPTFGEQLRGSNEKIMKINNDIEVPDPSKLRPEFIRLPKAGHLCPFTGLSRTTLNELVMPMKKNDRRPPVHSISMRQRGRMRGVRLIDYDSLVHYLRTQSGEIASEMEAGT